jgi:hypothetical protein
MLRPNLQCILVSMLQHACSVTLAWHAADFFFLLQAETCTAAPGLVVQQCSSILTIIKTAAVMCGACALSQQLAVVQSRLWWLRLPWLSVLSTSWRKLLPPLHWCCCRMHDAA